MSRFAIVLVLCSVIWSGLPVQAQSPQPSPPAILLGGLGATPVAPSHLGSTINVHQCGDLFLAGQFTQEDLKILGEEKIGLVITLRTPKEVKWDEQGEVEKAGMKFVQIPIGSADAMTDEVFDEVRKLLRESEGPTLFHCGSAVRVAGAWLPYRVLDENVPLEVALGEAHAIGLRVEAFENKAIDYIKRQQAESKPKPTSVNPGINDNFVDPNLDVDTYLKRFEIESREVYVARQSILAACQLKPGDRVADVGAGTGLFTRLFAETVGSEGWIYAIDISPKFIEYINQSTAAHKLDNVTGVLCAPDSINLPPASVDKVFVCDTYHHFEYPQATLASIHRALKPGGSLIVIDFERIQGKSRPWLMDHVRAGKEVFRAEIQDAGFTLVEEVRMPEFKENYFLRFTKE